MAKGGKVKTVTTSSNNGGIMNSGIFGMFGTVVNCKADDTSAFCTLSKIVNSIIMIAFLILVLYLLYLGIRWMMGSSTNTEPKMMTGGYIPAYSSIKKFTKASVGKMSKMKKFW